MIAKRELEPLNDTEKEILYPLLYSRLSKFVGYPNNEDTKKLIATEVNKVCYELGIVIP